MTTPMKKAFLRAVWSGVVPMVMLSGIAVMLNAQGKPADAKQTLFVGLIIGAVGLANIVYDVDS